MKQSMWMGAALVAAMMVVAGAHAGEPVDVTDVLKSSFKERGIAKLDRLNQSDLQRACSVAEQTGKGLSDAQRDSLQKAALAAVKFPADGQWLGDWKKGEAVAQSGRGLQFNDTEKTVAGGNCYACHQVSKEEISYGNIGPSLYNFGKLRGVSNPADPAAEPIIRYTWAKIWNSHAYSACSQMPRFGDAGILTEEQIKDVMALLLDPKSPVNQ